MTAPQTVFWLFFGYAKERGFDETIEGVSGTKSDHSDVDGHQVLEFLILSPDLEFGSNKI